MFTESSSWQADVALFMREVKGLDLPARPILQAPLIRELCKALMTEELEELKQALDDGNMIEIADGIADLIYVALYTANAYGLDMAPIFAEVQRSNMTKKGGPKAENGKQLKPASYEPPNIADIVQAQKMRGLL